MVRKSGDLPVMLIGQPRVTGLDEDMRGRYAFLLLCFKTSDYDCPVRGFFVSSKSSGLERG